MSEIRRMGGRRWRQILRVARDERHQEMGNTTVKRLAILVGVIALLGGGGYALWAFQVDRMAHGIVARADRAAAEGKYAEAERLYQEQLAVVPGDTEVELKYAEALLKQEKSALRQERALGVFESVVSRYPAREDVRRKAAELAFEIGAPHLTEKARAHLAILLGEVVRGGYHEYKKRDGHLEYLMGRCREQRDEFERAADDYKLASDDKAPERIDAAQRRAILLREKLGKKKEADQIIKAMVESAPDDYRVYLGRGRYLDHFNDKGAGDDFRKALELVKDRPEVYLELARAAEHEAEDAPARPVAAPDTARPAPSRPVAAPDTARRDAALDAARRVLEQGLAAAPRSVELYQALADLEQRAGRLDEAVKAMELGIKVMPDDRTLRFRLAMLLAGQGEPEAGRLLLHIAELERLGVAAPFIRYLTAHYHVNKREFAKAKQILEPLQVDVAKNPNMKAVVNLLLARCYAETGETEPQQEAMLKAYSANQTDPTTRMAWLQALIGRGDLDAALREYQSLYEQFHGGIARMSVAPVLAELLLERARRQPESPGRWSAVETLINQMNEATPRAVEPKVLAARLKAERGQPAQAIDDLMTIRRDFPKNPRPWVAAAELQMRDPKGLNDAENLLRQAGQQLGDGVELRLARMRLARIRGGTQVVAVLNELGRGVESFAREDRRRLLTALAAELARLQDLKGAAEAWERLARDDAENLEPRLQLFELALLAGDGPRAEARIRDVAALDNQFAALCRARLLAWQARAADPAAREKLREQARGLLIELKARKSDWARIPLSLAMLDEEELAEAGDDEARKREKLESAIAGYRRAIELGQRDPAVMRHLIELLFRAGRGSDALELYNQAPAIGPLLTGDLGRIATQVALNNRDFDQAEEIARKAARANPEDFQARVRLAGVLLAKGSTDEAEAEIRQGVDAAKSDPDRWVMLVRFLVMARRLDQAEQAARDAEAHAAAAPVALAQCCAVVGKAFELAEPERARPWYARARDYYARAQQARPDDLMVRRQFVEFLLQSNQAADAEGPLKELLARTADGKSPSQASWARRSLARVYLVASPPRTADALALFAGKSGRAEDPEDLRVMAAIHEAQGTPEGRRQAIGDLEALVGLESATLDDRRRFAQLLELAGEWPRARGQLQELVVRAETARDAETVGRRPLYLALLVEGLIRHHQPGDDSDLAEARQAVAKLAPISQADPMAPMLLEAQIDLAARQPEAAARRIRDYAAGKDLDTAGRIRLANSAEGLRLLDVAEAIFRRIAGEPPMARDRYPNQARLAAFLGRRGRIKDALDICERLWDDPDVVTRGAMANVSLAMLCNPAAPVDAEQIRRVLPWFERSAANSPRPLAYLVGMGNLCERLADYKGAAEAYQKAIRVNDTDGIASNNLAWLILLQDGPIEKALDLISTAVRVRGPLPEYLDTRGMIFVRAGQFRRGATDIETAYRAAPTPPKLFHLAQAYLRLNEKDKARRALEAGKARGLPAGLHRLELPAYERVAGELGIH